MASPTSPKPASPEFPPRGPEHSNFQEPEALSSVSSSSSSSSLAISSSKPLLGPRKVSYWDGESPLTRLENYAEELDRQAGLPKTSALKAVGLFLAIIGVMIVGAIITFGTLGLQTLYRKPVEQIRFDSPDFTRPKKIILSDTARVQASSSTDSADEVVFQGYDQAASNKDAHVGPQTAKAAAAREPRLASASADIPDPTAHRNLPSPTSQSISYDEEPSSGSGSSDAPEFAPPYDPKTASQLPNGGDTRSRSDTVTGPPVPPSKYVPPAVAPRSGAFVSVSSASAATPDYRDPFHTNSARNTDGSLRLQTQEEEDSAPAYTTSATGSATGPKNPQTRLKRCAKAADEVMSGILAKDASGVYAKPIKGRGAIENSHNATLESSDGDSYAKLLQRKQEEERLSQQKAKSSATPSDHSYLLKAGEARVASLQALKAEAQRRKEEAFAESLPQLLAGPKQHADALAASFEPKSNKGIDPDELENRRVLYMEWFADSIIIIGKQAPDADSLARLIVQAQGILTQAIGSDRTYPGNIYPAGTRAANVANAKLLNHSAPVLYGQSPKGNTFDDLRAQYGKLVIEEFAGDLRTSKTFLEAYQKLDRKVAHALNLADRNFKADGLLTQDQANALKDCSKLVARLTAFCPLFVAESEDPVAAYEKVCSNALELQQARLIDDAQFQAIVDSSLESLAQVFGQYAERRLSGSNDLIAEVNALKDKIDGHDLVDLLEEAVSNVAAQKLKKQIAEGDLLDSTLAANTTLKGLEEALPGIDSIRKELSQVFLGAFDEALKQDDGLSAVDQFNRWVEGLAKLERAGFLSNNERIALVKSVSDHFQQRVAEEFDTELKAAGTDLRKIVNVYGDAQQVLDDSGIKLLTSVDALVGVMKQAATEAVEAAEVPFFRAFIKSGLDYKKARQEIEYAAQKLGDIDLSSFADRLANTFEKDYKGAFENGDFPTFEAFLAGAHQLIDGLTSGVTDRIISQDTVDALYGQYQSNDARFDMMVDLAVADYEGRQFITQYTDELVDYRVLSEENRARFVQAVRDKLDASNAAAQAKAAAEAAAAKAIQDAAEVERLKGVTLELVPKLDRTLDVLTTRYKALATSLQKLEEIEEAQKKLEEEIVVNQAILDDALRKGILSASLHKYGTELAEIRRRRREKEIESPEAIELTEALSKTTAGKIGAAFDKVNDSSKASIQLNDRADEAIKVIEQHVDIINGFVGAQSQGYSDTLEELRRTAAAMAALENEEAMDPVVRLENRVGGIEVLRVGCLQQVEALSKTLLEFPAVVAAPVSRARANAVSSLAPRAPVSVAGNESDSDDYEDDAFRYIPITPHPEARRARSLSADGAELLSDLRLAPRARSLSADGGAGFKPASSLLDQQGVVAGLRAVLQAGFEAESSEDEDGDFGSDSGNGSGFPSPSGQSPVTGPLSRRASGVVPVGNGVQATLTAAADEVRAKLEASARKHFEVDDGNSSDDESEAAASPAAAGSPPGRSIWVTLLDSLKAATYGAGPESDSEEE